MKISIGIFGTYLENRAPRQTIGASLEHSSQILNVECAYKWIANENVSQNELEQFDGIFIAPGGALEDSENILKVISFARENMIPCLGTCGGFQRILTEYATNVLEIENIYHEEADPDTNNPLFLRLFCSIASTISDVILKKNSIAYKSYKKDLISESFYCNYGLNENYVELFKKSGVNISGEDRDENVRIIEFASHPFMVGTLFVPQVSSTEKKPHPLITEFLIHAQNVKVC